MRKTYLFSVMLSLGMLGGLTVCPVPAMASVTQQTIKVQGQVVDQNGEPLIGATVRVKGAQTGVVTDFDGPILTVTSRLMPLRMQPSW